MSRESFRGCLIQAGLSGLAVLALYGLVSNMSWENYEENKRLRDQENSEPFPGPNRDIPLPQQYRDVHPQQSWPEPTALPVNPPTQETDDNCDVYPEGISHRDEVCVNGQCDATFFGRRGPGVDTSWYVDWYDAEGQRHRLTCEEIPRSAVVPDPNH